ncbi:MAG: CAP domain-containing protein, partial [Candidatus Limnocylindrales bacterium]
MESSLRRLVPLVLVAGLLLAAAPPVTATDPSLAAAETTMVGLLNAQRTAAGLVPLQVDARLTTIARARSTDMAVNDYFGHQQPDGRYAWDLMNAAGIVWYGAGEIIGRTAGLTLSGSVTAVAQSWQASAPHAAIISSNTFNYFGVGVAIDATGRIIWTGVFMQGPDR